MERFRSRGAHLSLSRPLSLTLLVDPHLSGPNMTEYGVESTSPSGVKASSSVTSFM